jgi:hypothetical protein
MGGSPESVSIGPFEDADGRTSDEAVSVGNRSVWKDSGIPVAPLIPPAKSHRVEEFSAPSRFFDDF